MNLINWKFLAYIGNNIYVRRTYIYLFIIPLIVSIITKLDFLKSADLIPFNWQLLFLSAILFTLGTLIFQIFAPLIIKENSTYSDFISNGRIFWHLNKYSEDLKIPFDEFNLKYRNFRKENPLSDQSKEYMDAFMRTLPADKIEKFNFIRKYYDDQESKRPTWSNSYETGSDEVKFERIKLNEQLNQRIENENLKVSFWNILEYSKTTRFWARISCFVFFSIGLLCFVLVTINSILVVFQINGLEIFKWK